MSDWGLISRTVNLLPREGSPSPDGFYHGSPRGPVDGVSHPTHSAPRPGGRPSHRGPCLSPLHLLTSGPYWECPWLAKGFAHQSHQLLSLLKHALTENVHFEDSRVTCHVRTLRSPPVFCSVPQGEPGEKGVPGKGVSAAHPFSGGPFPGATRAVSGGPSPRQRGRGSGSWVAVKSPQTGWLSQQTLVSHSSGGWEVPDQGAGRSGALPPSLH